jgi:hypothetical protein
MPKQLDQAFEATIQRIQNQSEARKRQGLEALKWVFLAEEQLTIDALRHALSVRPGDTQLYEDGLPNIRSVLDCCLGLIIIDEGTSSVRLVHKSLQDFLER